LQTVSKADSRTLMVTVHRSPQIRVSVIKYRRPNHTSSVGIVTKLRPGRPKNYISSPGRKSVRIGPGLTQSRGQRMSVLSSGLERLERNQASHIHLVPWLRKSATWTPLPTISSPLAKRQINTYLYLYLFSVAVKREDEKGTPAFLNRRAAARYRALASIIPGRERFSWNW